MDGNRSSRRDEISLTCPCRLSDGITLELELLDVSPRGCRVRIGMLPLYFGQSITLFPEGIEEFTGTVRRSDEVFAGIEFDNELPHPVFERMRSHIPADGIEAVEAGQPKETPSPQPDAGATQDDAEDDETSQQGRPGFGSLSSITVTRRRQPAFGNKTVALPYSE